MTETGQVSENFILTHLDFNFWHGLNFSEKIHMEYTAYYVTPMLHPFSQTRYYFYNETSKYAFYLGLIAHVC